MSLSVSNQPPANIIAVILRVKQIFSAMADNAQIQYGDKYREDFGVGNDTRRVLFVYETNGDIGDPNVIGNECSITHSADVYVRAPATGDDIDRFSNVYKLVDRLLSALKAAGGGRVKFRPNTFKNSSPSKTDEATGAGVQFGMTFNRDVQKDADVYRVAYSLPDTSPSAVANPPPGEFPSSVKVDPTTTPVST